MLSKKEWEAVVGIVESATFMDADEKQRFIDHLDKGVNHK